MFLISRYTKYFVNILLKIVSVELLFFSIETYLRFGSINFLFHDWGEIRRKTSGFTRHESIISPTSKLRVATEFFFCG